MSDHSHLEDLHTWSDDRVMTYWYERCRAVDEGRWKEDPRMRTWLLVDFALLDQELTRRIRASRSLF